jgi:hypothetical protein
MPHEGSGWKQAILAIGLLLMLAAGVLWFAVWVTENAR